MKRQTSIIVALACGLAAALGAASSAGAQGQALALEVAGINNSGITGAAMLSEMGAGKIRVELRVDGAGAGPRPAHIHEGTCGDMNPEPKIPLTDVVNGGSTTELAGSLRQLTSAPHAIYLHRSPAELPVFVACANITPAGRLAVVPAAGGRPPWVDVAIGISALGLALAACGYALQRRARRT